jgi:ABC-2 type transport system ATP-binding protein
MTLPTISPLFFVLTGVALVFVIVFPIVLGALARRRLGVGWRYFGYGALIFTLFQLITRVPAVTALQYALAPQLRGSVPLQLAFGVGLAFTAGLFEEVGRYIGYRWLMRGEPKTWAKGVMYGLGHGGIESIVLVGGLIALQLINLAALQAIGLSGVPEAQRALVVQQLSAVAAQPPWLALAAAWERACAIAFHTAMSVLVLQVFRRGGLRWLALAVGLHTLLDLVTLATLLGLPPVQTTLLTEGLLTLAAVGSLWLIRRLREPDEAAQPPGGPPPDAHAGAGLPAADWPADPSNAIELRGLTRSFGDRLAVDRLTLDIPAGRVFGFLGPNGAGKTTTVRMLTALIAPSGGAARVAGFELGRDNQAIRRRVGILTETPGLYERLSALQNLVFFGQLYDLPPAQARAQAERYLRMMDLWERRDDIVGGFSKGMRQKLAITRALLHDPQIIFLDEPTSGLDPEASRMVRDFVKELRAEGRTIFLTTHNLPEADELCDLIGVFRTRLLRVDTPERLRVGLFGTGTLVRLAGEAAPWLETVRGLAFVQRAEASGETLSIGMETPERQNPALIQALVGAGAPIRYVEPLQHSLEDVYLELIGKE